LNPRNSHQWNVGPPHIPLGYDVDDQSNTWWDIGTPDA
jgi:hypothetical protein